MKSRMIKIKFLVLFGLLFSLLATAQEFRRGTCYERYEGHVISVYKKNTSRSQIAYRDYLYFDTIPDIDRYYNVEDLMKRGGLLLNVRYFTNINGNQLYQSKDFKRFDDHKPWKKIEKGGLQFEIFKVIIFGEIHQLPIQEYAPFGKHTSHSYSFLDSNLLVKYRILFPEMIIVW